MFIVLQMNKSKKCKIKAYYSELTQYTVDIQPYLVTGTDSTIELNTLVYLTPRASWQNPIHVKKYSLNEEISIFMSHDCYIHVFYVIFMFSLQRDLPYYLVPAVGERVPLGMRSGNVMCTVNTGNKNAM